MNEKEIKCPKCKSYENFSDNNPFTEFMCPMCSYSLDTLEENTLIYGKQVKMNPKGSFNLEDKIKQLEAENKELKEGISDSISFLDKFSFSSTSETVCGATTRDMHYRITDKLKTLLKQENKE